MSDQLAQALKAATAAIYFADSSDYLPALWDVVRSLSPEIAEIAERDARAAWQEADALAAAHEAAPQQEPAITVTIDDLDLVQDWAESRLPPGTHKLYAAPQQAQAPKVAVCDFVQVDDSSKSSRSQHDADSAELRSLCAERDELRRWKSTYAPRIAALEGSLQHAQREAAQGMEARSALASEREANAILTDELEAQQAQAPGCQLVPVEPTEAMCAAGRAAMDQLDWPVPNGAIRGVYVAMIAAASAKLEAPAIADEKLWLWQNGDHFWAFRHPYPCFTPGGDPMTLGDPVGFAILKQSHNRDGKD